MRPTTRFLAWLAKIAGEDTPELEPRTQLEYYLEKIAEAVAEGGGGGQTNFATGTLTLAEKQLTLTIDTGIQPTYFAMVRANFNETYPGHKAFNSLFSNFSRWLIAGTNNSGTGGAVHTSSNSSTYGKVTLDGTVVTIAGNEGSGKTIGSVQAGDWLWVAWR